MPTFENQQTWSEVAALQGPTSWRTMLGLSADGHRGAVLRERAIETQGTQETCSLSLVLLDVATLRATSDWQVCPFVPACPCACC